MNDFRRSWCRTLAADRLCRAFIAVALILIASACSGGKSASTPTAASTENVSQPTPAPSNAPTGPATFRVLAGHAEGAFDIERYMPADIHVRVGDTIEWTSQGIEGHTVTFVEQKQLNALLSSYLLPDPADPAQTIFTRRSRSDRGRAMSTRAMPRTSVRDSSAARRSDV